MRRLCGDACSSRSEPSALESARHALMTSFASHRHCTLDDTIDEPDEPAVALRPGAISGCGVQVPRVAGVNELTAPRSRENLSATERQIPVGPTGDQEVREG